MQWVRAGRGLAHAVYFSCRICGTYDFLVGNAVLGVPKICTVYLKSVGFGVPDEPIRRRRIM